MHGQPHVRFNVTSLVGDRYSISSKSRDSFCATPGAVPILWVPEGLFTGVKWPECAADSTLPYSRAMNPPTTYLPDTYVRTYVRTYVIKTSTNITLFIPQHWLCDVRLPQRCQRQIHSSAILLTASQHTVTSQKSEDLKVLILNAC